MIVRTRKPKNYTVINNTVLEDTRLSWRARGVAAYLLSKPDDWHINYNQLWQNGPEGRDAVIKSLNELEATGYLRRIRRRDEHGRFSTELVLYETPTPENPESVTREECTDSGKPGVGKPGVGKPGVGKPGVLLSTDNQLLKPNTTTTTAFPPENGGGGRASPEEFSTAPPTPDDQAAVLRFWQQNMTGTLTPVIVDDLNSCIADYGRVAVLDAITVAVRADVRTLRYVKGVLARRANAPPGNGAGNISYANMVVVPDERDDDG